MPAIEVNECGKLHRIYPSPQSRLLEWMSWDRIRLHEEFWALRDVSFAVNPGEAVGVVGLNGSGKSTLLQLIAGVSRPTQGSVRVNGRVGAILELGAGFNPEFTGRQNVRLYASVLGIDARSLESRMPQIEEFADIGPFFDRAVKLYSSGMYSRLAFAVTTQLEPEILIVDEALAVGDAMFQRKCMATLERMKRAGTTIFFVSHAIEMIKSVCDRAILLHKGRMVMDGAPIDVANEFARLTMGIEGARNAGLKPVARDRSARVAIATKRPELPSSLMVPVNLLDSGKDEFPYGTNEAEIFDLATLNENGDATDTFVADTTVRLRYRVRFDTASSSPIYGMTLTRIDGVAVYGMNTLYEAMPVDARSPGEVQEVNIRFPASIAPGNYYFTVGVCEFRGDRLVYLHRRCDAHLMRVLPVHPVVGIADLHGSIELTSPAPAKAAA